MIQILISDRNGILVSLYRESLVRRPIPPKTLKKSKEKNWNLFPNKIQVSVAGKMLAGRSHSEKPVQRFESYDRDFTSD